MLNKLTFGAISASTFMLPALAFAQSNQFGDGEITPYLDSFVTFINDVIIPVIIAIAILVFIWGIFQYFILGASDETKRDSGKKLMLWGLIGFVVIFAIVGIINLLVGASGLEGGSINSGDLPTLPTPGA